MHQTDETLALGIQQGDTEALAQLVQRHHHRLIGYLYRMTYGDRALAEDLAQEAFLRVLRNIRQYRYPRPFKPWLYAVATHLVRDHYKRAENRYAAATPLPDEMRASDAPLERQVMVADEAQQVIAALALLPQHQRDVVILRYYQSLTLAEIAAALNIPLGTVKSRLSLGVARLRILLTHDDAGERQVHDERFTR